MDIDYTGYKEVAWSDYVLEQFYNGVVTPRGLEMVENQYLVIRNNDGEVIDKYICRDGQLEQVYFHTIQSPMCGEIKPKNIEQELAFDLFSRRDIPVKLLRGVYGSGKDYVMISKALELVNKGTFEKIYYIRPNVTVKDVPDIGYLPSTAEDKLAWTLGPLYDKVGGQNGIDMLVRDGKLELMPLLFIRGRSFENSLVYVSEGQNITSEIAKLILGRIGEGSELWINADNHQTDNKVYDRDNGIKKMIERLSGNNLFGYVYLKQTLRSETANLANLLDD